MQMFPLNAEGSETMNGMRTICRFDFTLVRHCEKEKGRSVSSCAPFHVVLHYFKFQMFPMFKFEMVYVVLPRICVGCDVYMGDVMFVFIYIYMRPVLCRLSVRDKVCL